MKNKGQGLVEFVFVMPLIIVLLLGMVELALFWRHAQTVQQMALEAAIITSGTFTSPTNTATNSAVLAGVTSVQNRLGALGVRNVTLTLNSVTPATPITDRPYVLYRYTGGTAEGGLPLIDLQIDYRNPLRNGVITQLTYNYRTLFFGLEFPLANGRRIIILPRNIPISSTQIQEYYIY